MNPNDYLAQQQALVNQAMQNAQHMQLGALALSLASLLLTAWVIYMFYACFRRIEDEIRMFRISFEFANPPKEQGRTRPSGTGENPFDKAR